jgi:hypothetical protein
MSNKQSQREAVFSTIVSVLADHGVSFQEGTNVQPHMTKEVRAEVSAILVDGFSNGTIELATPYADSAKLKAYTSGLISNWVRKDSRLNGNTKYSAKNPGSRRGSSDPQMKALKALFSQATTDEDKEEIQGYIDERLLVIEAGKKKSTPIDFSVLPASLAAKFASN